MAWPKQTVPVFGKISLPRRSCGFTFCVSSRRKRDDDEGLWLAYDWGLAAKGNCLFMTLPVCWNNFSATFLTFPKEMCEIVESKLLGLFFKKASYISSHIHGLTKPISPKWHSDSKVYKTTEKTHCFFELQKESKRKITSFFDTSKSA